MGVRDVDCVVCGTCVADVLVRPVPLEASVGAGRLFHVDPVEVTTGGIVCNMGVAMRRLGATVEAVALVGDDLWGREIGSRLSAEGIGTRGIETRGGGASSATAVLIDANGERSFAHHVGVAGTLALDDLQRHRSVFARSRVAVLGYIGLLPTLERCLADAVLMLRRVGCRVVLETAAAGGSLADLGPALPHVDVFVPSLDEARAHAGADDPRSIIARYRSLGCGGVVGVKCGTRGIVLSPEPDVVVDVSCVAAPGPVIDTTGAGDSFLAGLVVGLANGLGAVDAARLGAAAAACCVTRRGATAGLRGLAETRLLAGL